MDINRTNRIKGSLTGFFFIFLNPYWIINYKINGGEPHGKR